MSASWHPYTIPSTPNVGAGGKYALSAKAGATSGTNPSKFLEWKEILPKGSTKGDILYWDPAAGDGGDWVVLAAPSGSGLKVLTATGGNLAWNDTEDC
jgi:hypothetical protein